MTQIKCLGCKKEIADVASALVSGCPSCQGRKLEFIDTDDGGTIGRTGSDPLVDFVAVKVKGRGEYQINLETLLKRKHNEPITIEDKNGVVRLVLNPDVS